MDPWSKWDYLWHIREASMVVEKLPEVNPSSDRVPGRGLLVLSILEARRRRNRKVFRDAGFSSRVYATRGKNRPKGGTRRGVAPLRHFLGGSASFRDADFYSDFSGILNWEKITATKDIS